MDAAVRGSSVGRARRGWNRPTGARGAVWPPPPRPSARQHHPLCGHSAACVLTCHPAAPALARRSMEDAYQAALAKAGGLEVAKPKAVRLISARTSPWFLLAPLCVASRTSAWSGSFGRGGSTHTRDAWVPLQVYQHLKDEFPELTLQVRRDQQASGAARAVARAARTAVPHTQAVSSLPLCLPQPWNTLARFSTATPLPHPCPHADKECRQAAAVLAPPPAPHSLNPDRPTPPMPAPPVPQSTKWHLLAHRRREERHREMGVPEQQILKWTGRHVHC